MQKTCNTSKVSDGVFNFSLIFFGVPGGNFCLMVWSDLQGRRVYEEHYGRRIPAMARGPQKGVQPALQLIGLTVSYKC